MFSFVFYSSQLRISMAAPRRQPCRNPSSTPHVQSPNLSFRPDSFTERNLRVPRSQLRRHLPCIIHLTTAGRAHCAAFLFFCSFITIIVPTMHVFVARLGPKPSKKNGSGRLQHHISFSFLRFRTGGFPGIRGNRCLRTHVLHATSAPLGLQCRLVRPLGAVYTTLYICLPLSARPRPVIRARVSKSSRGANAGLPEGHPRQPRQRISRNYTRAGCHLRSPRQEDGFAPWLFY